MLLTHCGPVMQICVCIFKCPDLNVLKQWRIKWLRFEGYFHYMVKVYEEVKSWLNEAHLTQNTYMYFVHITTKHIVTKLVTAQHVIQCTFCWIHRSSSTSIPLFFNGIPALTFCGFCKFGSWMAKMLLCRRLNFISIISGAGVQHFK